MQQDRRWHQQEILDTKMYFLSLPATEQVAAFNQAYISYLTVRSRLTSGLQHE
jgi:hypothetical protein